MLPNHTRHSATVDRKHQRHDWSVHEHTSVHEHVESTVPNGTGGEQIRTVPETSFTGTTNATLVSAKELH